MSLAWKSTPRLFVVLSVAALALAGAAAAAPKAWGYYYQPPKVWWTGNDANSSYGLNWTFNDMNADGPGYDKMTTFIDNVSYSWHNTTRNTAYETIARWAYNGTNRRGYCRWYDSRSAGANCFIGEK
jgi:hypothetical protein